MSLIDFDSWVTESEAVERMLFEIQTQNGQLKNVNQELPNSHSRTELANKIRLRLNQANVELQMLTKKLAGGPQTITRDELERRQRNLEKLQSRHFLLNKDFNGIAGNHTTIASSIIRPVSSSLWDDYDDNGGGSAAAVEPGEELRADQIIRSQNKGLENLSKIISRQRELALKISEEVTEQDEILDDIAVQMESTDSRINTETRTIETFTSKESSMALWLIILSLFIAIVVVWVI